MTEISRVIVAENLNPCLQQCGHRLGLGQLGDLEVLLVVRCVFADQPLLLHGEGRLLLLVPAPLATFVFVVLVGTATDDGLFRKVHGGLGKGKVLRCSIYILDGSMKYLTGLHTTYSAGLKATNNPKTENVFFCLNC